MYVQYNHYNTVGESLVPAKGLEGLAACREGSYCDNVLQQQGFLSEYLRHSSLFKRWHPPPAKTLNHKPCFGFMMMMAYLAFSVEDVQSYFVEALSRNDFLDHTACWRRFSQFTEADGLLRESSLREQT